VINLYVYLSNGILKLIGKNKYFQWRKLLAIAIVVLTAGFYVHYAVQNLANIPLFQKNVTTLAVIILSIVLVVFIITISGVIWHYLLSDHGIRLSWQQSQTIFAITQFGKYLPGNVGQYFGRVFMAREIGIPASVTTNTMLVEVIWGAGIGSGFALLSLIFFVDSHSLGFEFGTMQLGLVIVFLMLFPWFGTNFINKFMPHIARRLSGGGLIATPRPTTALVAALLFTLNFSIMGLILKLQAVWFFDVTAGSIFELTCLFAIAWLAGYLVPGAPGGLGVREAMMLIVLSPVLGAGAAVGLSLTLRLTTMLADAVAFGLGIIGRKWS
jgi:uncharacterized membrane protein YbhN (UPF0104 family)